jgi:hypothetical protein
MLGGLLLAGVSVVLLDSGIFHLVRTGSCGSSSTYISTRPCPPGTGGHILSLMGGIFGGLIGIGIYAARGSRGGARASIGLGAIMWSLLFVTIAASIAYAAYGPGNTHNSGAKTTAVILGVIFVPMGLAPLPFALAGRRKRDPVVQPAPSVPIYTHVPQPAVPAAAGDEDPIDKIAKLAQLRDRGLVTPEEFEAQKKRLLDEV